MKCMTQLSGAHAFRQFIRQLSTDFREILYRTFSSHLLTSVKFRKVICRLFDM